VFSEGVGDDQDGGDGDDSLALSALPANERGSGGGWITSPPSENDDVLRALDEFGLRTGGEHYYGRDQPAERTQPDGGGEGGADDEETIRIRSRPAPGAGHSSQSEPPQELEGEATGGEPPPTAPESSPAGVLGDDQPKAEDVPSTAAGAKGGSNSTSADEDLSAFMDEFELNTAGEDFRREEAAAPP
jgi:hypothetical protein